MPYPSEDTESTDHFADRSSPTKRTLELLQELPAGAAFQMLLKLLPMYLRGLSWKPRLGSSRGMLLIGDHVTIRNPQYIHLGNNFVAEDYCEIQGLSTEGIVIGDNVTIGRFAMIRPSGYYKGSIGRGMRVGNHSNIGPYCYIGCSGLITIGDNVLMGPRVSMSAENHNYSDLTAPIRKQGVTRKEISIADDCWLGSNSVITAGVKIGKGSIVAAGAVVTRGVPEYSIVAGIPARIVRARASDSAS